MNTLSNSDFDDLWAKAKTQIFRLEQYGVYRVPSDLEVFRRHEQNQTIRSSELLPDWYRRISLKVRNGVRVDRIRVLDNPLPSYQKYEIDWGYSVGYMYGQGIWVVGRELYDNFRAKAHLPVRDFWVFDDQPVFIEYTDGLDYIGPYLPESDEEVLACIGFKKDIMGRAFALRDYCEAQDIAIDQSRIIWDVAAPNQQPIP